MTPGANVEWKAYVQCKAERVDNEWMSPQNAMGMKCKQSVDAKPKSTDVAN